MAEKQKMTIVVNGKELEGFKSASVTKSVLNLCGSFSFLTIYRTDFPMRVFDKCEIWVEGYKVLTGYIEKITSQKTTAQHDLNISGRDITADLQDSTMSGAEQFVVTGLTLKQIIEKLVKTLGLDIKVINQVSNIGTYGIQDNIMPEFGSKYFDFIETYARQKQVLLTTNGDGAILIFRSNLNEALKTNIGFGDVQEIGTQSKSISRNSQGLFYKYICISAFTELLKEIHPKAKDVQDGIQGKAFDSLVRKSRRYYFQDETATSYKQLNPRAIWERNNRRIAALNVSYVVDGFIPRDDPGMVWPANRIVIVKDSEEWPKPVRMLTKTVTFSYGLDRGSETTLELCDPLALTLEETKPDRGLFNPLFQQLFASQKDEGDRDDEDDGSGDRPDE